MLIKAQKALKAMLAGQEIDIDGRTFTIQESNGKYHVLMKCHAWRNGKLPSKDEPEIEWHHIDMGLEYFLNACEKLNDDDLFILAAERALTEINREGGPSRI